ncbi:MAG: DNA-directed RNA polymerase subunit alpha [Gemmatimonadaceae bacterium]|nr:DNA-directed RNA polymerase subunit alpha [Gemmatimonadaceae bacterium]MCW5825486.1 DNA-directed RNA polymerase subunit alpha [Gemmatimonadaceae bacterium]
MSQTIDLRGLVRPQLVEMTKRDDNANVAEFRLQPLERGFGHTLGNAMRRMLLSSLRGAAVWGFRIDGVLHEHQTIPGVVEDVHQIIANLKTLTLALDDDVEDAILRLKVTKSGAVTAGQLELPGGARVINAAHHILTLQDDRDLSIELYVNKGRGYVEAEQHPADRSLPVDLVRIDSIYSPVKRANFAVAETRVGQRTDYDRLSMTVETNGTLSPEQAVSYAAALAQTHFQYFASFGTHTAAAVVVPGAEGSSDAARLAELLRTPIDDLQLSVRSVNSLKNSSIRSLGDLVRQTEAQILQVKNFGKKSLQEIADLLEKEGLNFGMRFEESTDGVRVADWGTPPSRAAAAAPDDDEEE